MDHIFTFLSFERVVVNCAAAPQLSLFETVVNCAAAPHKIVFSWPLNIHSPLDNCAPCILTIL